MKAPSDGSLHGDSIEALQQELAATNVILLALKRELSSSQAETNVRIEGMRAEQARERRVRMMYVGAAGVATVSLYDQHVEHCSPGARVVHGLDYLLSHPAQRGETPEHRQAQFAKQYDHAPTACDVTLPLHTHDGSAWPTSADLVGMTVLAAVVLAVGVYHRWRTRTDYANVSKVLEAEETHSAHPRSN